MATRKRNSEPVTDSSSIESAEEDELEPEPEVKNTPDERKLPRTEGSPKKELTCEREEPPGWVIWSAASYAVVMLVIGLPLWWKTTAVQRAYLPYDQMLNSKSLMQQNYKLVMDMNLYGFSQESETEPAFQAFHEGHRGFEIRYSLRGVPSYAMDALYKNNDLSGTDLKLCERDKNVSNVMNLYYVGRADLLKKYGKRIIMGNCRTAYYISNSNKLKIQPLFNFLEKLAPSGYKIGKNPEVSDKLQLPLSLGYDFLLTLIVPEPEIQDYSWNMELSRQKYLPALFGKLEDITAMNVRSQYLYYTKLNVNPRYNKEKDIYEVPHEQLPLVINPVESKLTSFVSQNTVLNFLVYTSPCSQNPMQILDENNQLLASNSFLVPQWGGIQIYNAACPDRSGNNTSPPLPHQVSLSQIFSIVATQLRELFGVPGGNSEDVLELRNSVFRDWEVDVFARKRLHTLLHTTANTLQSLGQLLDQITNIVVTDEVGEEVHNSTESLESAVHSASQGHLIEAIRHATDAYRASETAFHHPSNLAQLYFPDDQKYAIYIPLFLPIGIPVLVSLRTIANYFMQRKKAKVD